MVKKKRKKVGLTLGGGGARGFAHIGIHDVLTSNDIPIDYISGCSMGAIVGAGIAQGKSTAELIRVVKDFVNHKPLSPFKLGFKKGGIFSGKSVVKSLKKLIDPDLEFKDLKIPFRVNAVDIELGQQVVFSEGKVLDAVLASSALPGLYQPVYKNGRLFVDGGVLNTVPVKICREMGADILIAVDLNSYISEQNISGLIYHFFIQKHEEKKYHLNIKHNPLRELRLRLTFPMALMMRSMGVAERENTEEAIRKVKPEILLHPKVGEFSILDFEEFSKIFRTGSLAAEKALPDIKKLLKT